MKRDEVEGVEAEGTVTWLWQLSSAAVLHQIPSSFLWLLLQLREALCAWDAGKEFEWDSKLSGGPDTGQGVGLKGMEGAMLGGPHTAVTLQGSQRDRGGRNHFLWGSGLVLYKL